MKILRTTDRITVKIDDVTLKLAPMNFEQKSEVQGLMMEASKGNTQAGIVGAKLAVKYSVKDMKGIETVDGDEYSLNFENDILTEECVNDLINSEMNERLMITCCSLLQGIKQDIINPVTQKPLEGVTLLKNVKRAKKKK